jgi:hypothetical protein
MYRWFTRFSALPEISAEPKLVIEKDETLWCTPGGQVAGLDSRPIYAFTEERAKNLAKQRPEKGGAELENAIRKTLHILDRRNVPEYRILRPISGRRYPLANFTTYAVETEPNVFALVYRLSKNTHLSRPARFDQPAVLYIAHQSSDVELREEPLISELLAAEPESVFYACDVRGIGESRPNTCGEQRSDSPYGSDYFYAAYALMLDYPVAGQRAYDVLKVLDWLASFGHTAIHLAAKGWGTIPATFAAILSPSVVRITLKNAPRSYTEIAESEDYSCPLALLPQGLLHYFDLPDCYRELKKKSLRIIDAVGSRL